MNIFIRKANKEDSLLIFNWANDYEVRKNSFSGQEIKWEDHQRWFAAKLTDPNSFFFIFFIEKEEPVGLIRIDKGEKTVIGVTIASEYRGKGFGKRIIESGCAEFWKTNQDDVYAYIKCSNTGSIRAFEKANFSIVDNLIINEAPSFILISSKNDN